MKESERQTPRPPTPDPEVRNKQIRWLAIYLLVGLVSMWLFQELLVRPVLTQQLKIPYSEFKEKLADGQVIEATIGSDRITGILQSAEAGSDPVPFITTAVLGGDNTLIAQLDQAGVRYANEPPPSPVGSFLLAYLMPMLMVGVIFYFGYRQLSKARGGAGGVMSVGRSKATEVQPEEIGVTFADVGGADEAIAELSEIIAFLKDPERFSRLGGRIPKGVMLVGPPGTGKTLLAKATAGEAHVPFFETSGSEFVEMFVGVGAARVRDLFENARKVAPAIVFIDEIDAIGQSRGGSIRLGGNEEREQTLNQLLAEIDGFSTTADKPVIIMAATNRPEILDPALLRAGRFDRQIAVAAPDLIGRMQILRIHSKNLMLSPDFDLDRAARMTPGFTGADLANVLNEAALLAARRGASDVTMADFEASLERVVAGLERRTRVMSDEERTAVAYHEVGHAMVAELLPGADPVAKVSIVPRGVSALGYTMQLPTEDRYVLTEQELLDRIAVMLGGRAAEFTVFGCISTGASDDINRATQLARRMVTEFGMSPKLGPVRYATNQYQFLESPEAGAAASQDTLRVIESEVQRVLTEQYERGKALLAEHRTTLDGLTQELLETESLSGNRVAEALGNPRD